MTNFADRLREQLSNEKGARNAKLKDRIVAWIEDTVLANLEAQIEASAERGEDTTYFRLPYDEGEFIMTTEVEGLPSYVLLAERAKLLGLDILALSHKVPPSYGAPGKYPQLEIRIKVPPAYKAENPDLNISSW